MNPEDLSAGPPTVTDRCSTPETCDWQQKPWDLYRLCEVHQREYDAEMRRQATAGPPTATHRDRCDRGDCLYHLPAAEFSAAPTVTGDTATGDVRPLVCPYCAARIMPVHEYVGRDRGGEVFDGYECGNIRCDARWDKNGTPTGPPLSATGRGVGVTGDTATAAEPCPTCSPPLRETVGMVCQTCGTDYGPLS